jgi:hypothetical protein
MVTETSARNPESVDQRQLPRRRPLLQLICELLRFNGPVVALEPSSR